MPIAIWRVSIDDEASLDRYEGYPTFYYKADLKIELEDKTIDAFVCIMHEYRPLGVPSDYYVEICREGYLDFEFNQLYLTKAINRSKEQDTI